MNVRTLLLTTSAMVGLGLAGALAQTQTQPTQPQAPAAQPAQPPAAAQQSTQQPAATQPAPKPATAAAVSDSSMLHADKLLGQKIIDSKNENAGTLDGIILDKDGNATQVLARTGAVLGLGGKQVELKWSDLIITPPPEGKGDFKLSVRMTSEDLAKLPEHKMDYVVTTRPAAPAPAPATPPKTTEIPKSTAETQAPAGDTTGTAQPKPTVTQESTQQTVGMKPPATATAPATPATKIYTKELIGQNLTDAKNESAGEINDIVFAKEGKVQLVLVKIGGVLGVGGKTVEMKWNDLAINQVGDKELKVSVRMNSEDVSKLPEHKMATYQ